MSDGDRKARVEELRRLVQTGEYKVEPHEVAASIIRKSVKPKKTKEKSISKRASTGQ